MSDDLASRLRALLGRLKEDGGRYLLSVALTREEFDAQPAPTYGGKGHVRWLADDERDALLEVIPALEAKDVQIERLTRELAEEKADRDAPRCSELIADNTQLTHQVVKAEAERVALSASNAVLRERVGGVLEELRALLCDPDNRAAIHGSDADRDYLDQALAKLEAIAGAQQGAGEEARPSKIGWCGSDGSMGDAGPGDPPEAEPSQEDSGTPAAGSP